MANIVNDFETLYAETTNIYLDLKIMGNGSCPLFAVPCSLKMKVGRKRIRFLPT